MWESFLDSNLMDIAGTWILFVLMGLTSIVGIVMNMWWSRRRKMLNRLYDSRSDSPRIPPLVVYHPTRKPAGEWKILRK